jgi:hypothetical protein
VLIENDKPPRREYNTLKYLGRGPKRSDLKHKLQPYHKTLSENVKYLDAHLTSLRTLAGNKFVMVEPSIENVNLTITSFDNAKYSNFRDNFFEFGKEFLATQYGHIFPDGVASSEELHDYVDWTKSAGYTATASNIYSKGELVKDPLYLKSDYHLNNANTVPIVSVAVKRELKKIDEVMANKIRLFFISEFHLCLSQIKFGKRSSSRLKNFKWSAYGFSPWRGGVHELAQKLLSKVCRFYYDVSGWDKFIPIMEDLYKVISACSDIPDNLKTEFEWMIQNTIAFVCALWDGDVILKNYGNCSGSGTTTRDNILMHIILAATFLAEAYYIKNGKLPSVEVLAAQIVKLFGDDSVFAVDAEFDHVMHRKDESDGFLRNFFARYGMKLKFLHGGTDFPVDQMEFLGFRFALKNGRYVPYYDPVRLAHSFVHTNDRCDDLGAYISKCFVLTMMSYATEHCDLFLAAYKTLIINVDKLPNQNPTVASFTNIGPLTEEILEAFYNGSESTLIDFSFFESVMEEVGIKESFDHEYGTS